MTDGGCAVTDVGIDVRVISSSDESSMNRRIAAELADGWRLAGPVAAAGVGPNLWLVATLYRPEPTGHPCQQERRLGVVE